MDLSADGGKKKIFFQKERYSSIIDKKECPGGENGLLRGKRRGASKTSKKIKTGERVLT